MTKTGDTERRLVAIFAADVEGYSRLMGADEVSTLKDLTQRRDILDGLIASRRGRIANTAGDSVLAEFGSAVDAIQCAVEAQAALSEANADLPPDRHINFRIGVHVGDVMIKGGDLFGDGVNIAARLQTLARAGGVCLSGVAYDQVRKVLPFAFADLGAQRVKNIDEPVRVFSVSAKGVSTITRSSNVSVPLALPDKPSIAVLPFQNMSGDPEQEYFADGMVEEIITALSRNKQLFVIARNSSFTFKGKAVDIKQVALDLGVRYVLEGSVRKSGSRVRITGQLIDAASGAHLWADKYDGALEEVFELQDQVAASVVGAINPSILRAEVERVERKRTSSLEAYDYYLRGLAAQWQSSRESFDRAAGFYEQAIALDPQYSTAYAMLANLLVSRITMGWSTDQAGDNSRAITLAKTALNLQQTDPWVLTYAAWGLTNSSHEVELTVSLFDEAIRLDPNGALAWTYGGWAKMYLGDHQTAIHYLQRALRLNPLDPRNYIAQNGLAFANFLLGDYEAGLKFATEALRYRPNFLPALRIAMACSALRGDTKAAQEFWRRLVVLHPNERVSDLRKRAPYREQDYWKLEEAFRMGGMPE